MTDLNGYAPIEYVCKCGKTHRSYTRIVVAEDNALEKLPSVCKEILAEGRLGIVCDENVRPIAERAESLLARAGYLTKLFVLPAGFSDLRAQAKQLVDAREDVRLWVAVGTGSIADTVRFAASERANEWVAVPTAPTTDSILYPYCDFFENGERTVVRATPPAAAVADYTVIENAPRYTVAAGYGTMLSKLLRVFDFAFDEVTDKGRCKFLTEEFCEDVAYYFDTQSCESDSLRLCRSLIRLGIVSQLADEEDFCQGSEYFAARCLRSRCKDARLTGENAAICTFAAYCILESYLSVAPDDLYIPARLPDYFRYLDKNCGLNHIKLLAKATVHKDSEAHLYVLREYSEDLLSKLRELFEGFRGYARHFRRTYEDAGYWLGAYCDTDTVVKTVTAAYATFGDGLLSSMARGGALGFAFRDTLS